MKHKINKRKSLTVHTSFATSSFVNTSFAAGRDQISSFASIPVSVRSKLIQPFRYFSITYFLFLLLFVCFHLVSGIRHQMFLIRFFFETHDFSFCNWKVLPWQWEVWHEVFLRFRLCFRLCWQSCRLKAFFSEIISN